MIRRIEISGSDYNAMQGMLNAMPELSASISTTASILDPIIICDIEYQRHDTIPSFIKYMYSSCAYCNDLG